MKDTSLFPMWLLFMEWIKHIVENVTTLDKHIKKSTCHIYLNNFVEQLKKQISSNLDSL